MEVIFGAFCIAFFLFTLAFYFIWHGTEKQAFCWASAISLVFFALSLAGLFMNIGADREAIQNESSNKTEFVEEINDLDVRADKSEKLPVESGMEMQEQETKIIDGQEVKVPVPIDDAVQ